VLERAGRVADFLEFGELMCRDALHRNESCGGHFREEYQTERGRSACATTRISATPPPGNTAAMAREPSLHKEPLEFNEVHLTQRSYK
jgi:succinate dehydrogenase / fumarate reductase flavoprotein subunit